MRSIALSLVVLMGAVCGLEYPVYEVNAATPFEAGVALGKVASERIKSRLMQRDINVTIKAYLATPSGRALFLKLQTAARAFSELLYLEMQGIALGTGLSFDDIFILNALTELNLAAGVKVTHCTDVITHADIAAPVWGHNEDSGVEDASTSYYVNVTIRGDEVNAQFFAFAYPGTLGGVAFAWNGHGLVFTQNQLFSQMQNWDGIPAQICGRLVLGAVNTQEALRLLTECPSATSWNMNIFNSKGSFNTTSFHSLEKDPLNVVGIRRTPTGTAYYHTNMYQLLSTPQFTDASSTHRNAVLATYPIPRTTSDVRRMLGDTSDKEYPVYRTGNAPDTDVVTMVTAVFDFVNRVALLYGGNPATSDPVLSVPL